MPLNDLHSKGAPIIETIIGGENLKDPRIHIAQGVQAVAVHIGIIVPALIILSLAPGLSQIRLLSRRRSPPPVHAVYFHERDPSRSEHATDRVRWKDRSRWEFDREASDAGKLPWLP